MSKSSQNLLSIIFNHIIVLSESPQNTITPYPYPYPYHFPTIVDAIDPSTEIIPSGEFVLKSELF